MQVANDSRIYKAVSGKSFYSSRYFAPAKNVQKQYGTCELYVDFDPLVRIPGLVVWASVNDGEEFRLELANGDQVIREKGFHELFFPTTAAAVGDYVQLRFEVPALAEGEVPVAVLRLEATVRGLYQPLVEEVAHAVLILTETDRRSVREQMRDLLSISRRGRAPVPMQDIFGNDAYCHIPMPAFRELGFKDGEPQRVAAIVDIRKVHGL
jgi:hypothetical protein